MANHKQVTAKCPKGGDWIFALDDEGSLLVQGIAPDGVFVKGGLSVEATDQVQNLLNLMRRPAP